MTYQPITRPVTVARDLHAARFEDVDVNLFELYAACAERSGLIMGRTFVRCRIQGPAIMLVSAGVMFDGCNFGDRDGDMRNLVLRPAGPRALGTVPMRDCRFEGCEFFNVGFTGSAQVIDMLLAVSGEPAR